MSWAAVMLFGSGLVFSTGLVWFFVQAWIFAIEARTIWLIVLLTITTTVAILSQGYLCAIFVSIPPGPKPRGVTQANREVFASFPFDATASLVRRKGSDTRPSVGWEVKKPAQQVTTSPGHEHHPPCTAASTTAVVGDAEDDRQEQQPDPAGGESQRLPPPVLREEEERADHGSNPARSPKGGEILHLMAPSAGGGRGRAFAPSSVAEAPVTEPCVEDVVESGRADPFVLTRAKSSLGPLGPSKLDGREIEENGGMRPEGGVLCESLDDTFAPKQHFHRCRRSHHHHHQHPNQEMKRCSTWTASGQADATATPGSDDGNNDNGGRFRCGSVGSSINCCGEAADIGCVRCADGKEVLAGEQQARKAAGVLPLLAEQEETTPSTPSGGGGGERLTDEPVVRVSELPNVCAICLGQYATGEEVHVLPCLHIFHAECLDIWITGHPSCPYCKGDLNVLPPESDPASESSAAAYTCSMLSGLTLLFTWPFDLVREFRDRRRRPQQEQEQEQGQEQQQQQQPAEDQPQPAEDHAHDHSNANLASTPSATPASASPSSSLAVLPAVVA